MDGFLNWFFAFMTTMLDGLWKIISGLFTGVVQIFNLSFYFQQFTTYAGSFSAIDWVFSVLAFFLTFAIWALLLWLLMLAIRKYIRFRRTIVGNEDLLEELADMHRDVLRLTREKERLMALKIGQTSIPVEAINAIFNDREQSSTAGAGSGDMGLVTVNGTNDNTEVREGTPTAALPGAVSRFARLSAVDEKYAYYVPPVYRKDVTLTGLCDDFRNFACSRMHLYYEQKTIRLMLSGLAATKMILLQGISGTGKTSLPYAMGKFFKQDATIASVQPSWRDRTALFGYFNEFTKRFNETEALRRIYESSYNDDINIIVLDEMNIARVEYYFAEMLSVLEMPDPREWHLELVPSAWGSDPKHLADGRLYIPQNIWYIGTANNDDSTFAVSDKVYDRALVINLDSKGIPFEAPDVEPYDVSYTDVESLYRQAVADYPVSTEILDKISHLDLYVIQKFRIAFGNRIMKQMMTFVPVYVACGGTALEGVDYILTTKVFRKFESLNMSVIREEVGGLVDYLDRIFGAGEMKESIAYLERLKKMY